MAPHPRPGGPSGAGVAVAVAVSRDSSSTLRSRTSRPQDLYFAAKHALFQMARENRSDLLDSRAFEICLTGTEHGMAIKSRSICS